MLLTSITNFFEREIFSEIYTIHRHFTLCKVQIENSSHNNKSMEQCFFRWLNEEEKKMNLNISHKKFFFFNIRFKFRDNNFNRLHLCSSFLLGMKRRKKHVDTRTSTMCASNGKREKSICFCVSRSVCLCHKTLMT